MVFHDVRKTNDLQTTLVWCGSEKTNHSKSTKSTKSERFARVCVYIYYGHVCACACVFVSTFFFDFTISLHSMVRFFFKYFHRLDALNYNVNTNLWLQILYAIIVFAQSFHFIHRQIAGQFAAFGRCLCWYCLFLLFCIILMLFNSLFLSFFFWCMHHYVLVQLFTLHYSHVRVPFSRFVFVFW